MIHSLSEPREHGAVANRWAVRAREFANNSSRFAIRCDGYSLQIGRATGGSRGKADNRLYSKRNL